MQIQFALHPTLPLLATIGDSQGLILWNATKFSIIVIKVIRAMRGAASKSDLYNQVTKIYCKDKKSFFSRITIRIKLFR